MRDGCRRGSPTRTSSRVAVSDPRARQRSGGHDVSPAGAVRHCLRWSRAVHPLRPASDPTAIPILLQPLAASAGPPGRRSSPAPPGRRARRGWPPSRLASPRRIRLTGASSFLPVSVRGIPGTTTISSGTWRGDSWLRRADTTRLRSAVVDVGAGRGDDEQQQLAHPAAGVLEVDDERVGHLGQVLDDRVELAGPQPHAATVERRVAAAGEHAAAALGELDPVALAPDPRVDGRSRSRGSARRRGRPTGRRASTAVGWQIDHLAALDRSPCCPSSSKARASTPRHEPAISPSYTGRAGLPDTSPEQTSVPPDPLISRMSGPSCS